ncbi:dolichyl-phosphate-mannose--protein mannosyltransferase [Corallococcus sp. H22C18031201]|nr:dolichyl-phosphate-mannose--protein mannosyltransferase [Corallococcus sp. H22C18031201]
MSTPSASRSAPSRTKLDVVLLAALVIWGLAQLAPHLAHPAIYNWDEAMHQAAARGTLDTFFTPHIYKDPLYPSDPRHWWAAHVWMHKPTGPFWFAALMMRVIGVTPLALRLASLLGHLAAAGSLYLIARRPAGRTWAMVGAAAFLALPFGWQLVQGRFFGDVTDCTLAGCNAVATALLFHATRERSWRWGIVAGVVVGLGFLCKTGLALTPLGVAVSLWVLGRLRFCEGPRLGTVVAMLAAAWMVAAPWSFYSAWKWPELHALESRVTRAHLIDDPSVDVGPWRRPLDAIINEINTTSFQPIPGVVLLLAYCALLVRAVRRRELEVVGLSLWVGATWFVLSLGAVKVPAIAWGAVPGALASLVIVGSEARRQPVVAALLTGGLASPLAIRHLPVLTRAREMIPVSPRLEQTRTWPGLAEGLMLASAAMVLGLVIWRLSRKAPWLTAVVGIPASALLAWQLLITVPVEKARYQGAHAQELYVSSSREVGLALAKATPARSVLFEAVEMDPPLTFETLSLMFWSGRMAYRVPPDVPLARSRGYHAYLVSPLAEPYAPVPGVPAHAAMRAYDLEEPRPTPPPLPEGVTPLSIREGNLEVLGYATGDAGGGQDRYAFYVRVLGPAQTLRVTFHSSQDGIEERELPLSASLRHPPALSSASWFILPTVGPRLSQLTHLELGSVGQRVAVAPAAP